MTLDLNADVATIIAICALSLAIWQGYLQRHHYHISIRPNLNLRVDYGFAKDGRYYFEATMVNNGFGLAVFNKFKLKYKNETIAFADIVGRCFSDFPDNHSRHYALDIATFSLAEKESITLLYIETKEPIHQNDIKFNESVENVFERFANLKLEIEYKSLYGEKTFFLKGDGSDITSLDDKMRKEQI